MDRDTAVRLDGILMGAQANLDGIAQYMKHNLSAEEFSDLVSSIGKSMTALIDISSAFKISEYYPKGIVAARR